MNKTLVAKVAAAGFSLALLASGSAAGATLVINGFTLDTGSFGAQTGVHFTAVASNVHSAPATVNGAPTALVTFASNDFFDSNNGGGEAVIDNVECGRIRDGNCQQPFNVPFDDLSVTFAPGWERITFNFKQFAHTDSFMTLSVNNGAAIFTGGIGGNCSFCTIDNGANKFTIERNGTAITTLQFNFSTPIESGRQFRVENIADVVVTTPVPEPAIWAMMIAGFGGVGALMRRRRTVVA